MPIASFDTWCYTLSEKRMIEVGVWCKDSCFPTVSWCV